MMLSYICRAESCRSSPEIRCDGCNLLLCRPHATVHFEQFSDHICKLIVESPQEVYMKVEFSPQPHEQESRKYRLVKVLGTVHIFYLDSVFLSLPTDYSETFKSITNTFADKIFSMSKGKSEKIKSKCSKLVEIASKIIYNLKVDTGSLYESVLGIYTKFHSSIEDITCTGLIKFLENAEISLQMPKSVKKMLVKSTTLEQQKEIFIEKFFMKDNFTIPEINTEFFKIFKDFIGPNPKNITNLFDTFEVYFRREKTKVANEAKKQLVESINNYWTNETYIRLGLLAFRVPATSESLHISGNSLMTASLLLQSEKAEISSVISLSEAEVLLTISLETKTFIIYQNPSLSCILLMTMAGNAILAAGSTKECILFVQNYPKSIDLYSLNYLTLEKTKNLNFFLELNEDITDIVFVQKLNKAIFLTNSNSHIINSLIIQGGYRLQMQIDAEGESFLAIDYCQEKDIICVKTETSIKIFSIHMQSIYTVKAPGNNLICISDSIDQVIFLINHTDFFFKVNVYIPITNTKIVEENSENRFWGKNFEQCNHTLKQIFEEKKTGKQSKYAGYLNRKFMTPDLQIDFNFLKYA